MAKKVCKLENNTIKLRNPRTSHFQTSTGIFLYASDFRQMAKKWRKTETSSYILNSRQMAKKVCKLEIILLSSEIPVQVIFRQVRGYFICLRFSPSGEKRKRQVILNSRQVAKNGNVGLL